MIASSIVEFQTVDTVAADDLALRLAIAKEVFGYADVQVDSAGRITAESPTMITVPHVLRNWTRYQVSATAVESVIHERGLSAVYLDRLRNIVGDVTLASARQKCEAALEAVRSVRIQ